MAKQKHEVPTLARSDYAHSIAKASIGSVPLVGNASVELFQVVFAPPIESRRVEWMERVAESLRELEARGCNIEELGKNPVFIETVMQASHAAIRTSQQEKLDALRNAVLNAGLPCAPDASRQAIFLNWVDQLTVLHLRILSLFADPLEWFHRNGRQPPQYHITSSLSGLLTDAFPELSNQRALYDKIAKDLYNDGLLGTEGLQTMMNATGAFEKRATPLGNEFIKFITDSKS